MTEESRDQLQKQQAKLIHALQGRTQIPTGFDAKQVSAAAHALLRKRCSEVRAAWPALAAYLGDRFFNLFKSFVNENQSLQPDPVADGYLFTTWLSSRERLPADVIVAVRCYEVERNGWPQIWWQPDRRKVMIAWRWCGRARSIALG